MKGNRKRNLLKKTKHNTKRYAMFHESPGILGVSIRPIGITES